MQEQGRRTVAALNDMDPLCATQLDMSALTGKAVEHLVVRLHKLLGVDSYTLRTATRPQFRTHTDQ